MLISIIIITYNSSKYILETLESCYRQTYKDIELIVSDDCSTDDTFCKCSNWIESHKHRFVRTICTQTSHNKGICGNYNHGLMFVKGDWIKYIAGDDFLLDDCIDKYVVNIRRNTFLYLSGTKRLNELGEYYKVNSYMPDRKAKQQLRYSFRRPFLVQGPTLFFKKKHLAAIGGFDMLYPMCEDYPIILKYLTNNLSINTILEPLVMYRIHDDSVSRSVESYFTSSIDAYNYYNNKYMNPVFLLFLKYHHFVNKFINNYHTKGFFYKSVGCLFRIIDYYNYSYKIFPVSKQKVIKL